MEENRYYAAIDLKSFYASVECIERGLDPLDANLVVADSTRTEKTICLAVSPGLKAYGIPGRPRLFEVVSKVKQLNSMRRQGSRKEGELDKSISYGELQQKPHCEIDYIVAPPRMALYMEYSTRIYDIYLQFVAEEDMHVYSVDEVFIDLTHYLKLYQCDAKELTARMIKAVYEQTGITATAGIGTNLYLAKVAMDIVAKHMQPNEYGVRMAQLDVMAYRRILWGHKPLTDFWRVGRGYARKLEQIGIYTMGDIARCSVGKENEFYNAERLYQLFGVNAELLIDHAWGHEPCTISEIKAYRPENNSTGSGQVLTRPYSFEEARVVTQEMLDALALDLVDKGLVSDQIVLTVGYDIESLTNPYIAKNYRGEITQDRYGRKVPKHAHGTANLSGYTASRREFLDKTLPLFDQIVHKDLLIRRLNVVANHLYRKGAEPKTEKVEQMELFVNYEEETKLEQQRQGELLREEQMQKAMLDIKKRYGKNAILRGTNFKEGATARSRNEQIGGHKA